MHLSENRLATLRQWAFAFSAATFVILVLGAHSYAAAVYSGDTSKWMPQMVRWIFGWYLWAAIFPIVLTLAGRFRFASGSILKSALVHTIAGLAITALHGAIQLLIVDWWANPDRDWNTNLKIFQESFAGSFFWPFFVYQGLLAVCIALDTCRRAKETEIRNANIEASLLHTEIETLQMRLDPGFLFESFNQLSKLMHTDRDEAESLVARLGEYLRMRLEQSGSAHASLRDEIECLKCFLEIEACKTKNELAVGFDLAQCDMDSRVPSMILQAAVEDLIDGDTSRSTPRLKIGAIKTEGELSLTIENLGAFGAVSETRRLDQLLQRWNRFYRSPIKKGVVSSKGSLSVQLRIPSVLQRADSGDFVKPGQKPDASEAVLECTVPASNPVRKWLIITGIFTMLAIYFTLQRVVIFGSRGTPMNWPQQLLDVSGWYVWALLTPVVLSLSARYPLIPERWIKHGAIHFVALLVLWVFATLIMVAIRWAANLGQFSYLETLPLSLARSPLAIDVIGYATILAIENAARYHRRFESGKIKQVRLAAQLARAKLDTLKMQLHPHFLFNALHSLSELIQEDSAAAEQMIRNLERFLKLTLNHDVQEIPFEQELEFLKSYLEIETVRFQDRLHVKMLIEPQTLKIPVPNLVLQPIVENAIRHAIAPRVSAGEIEIRATRNNGTLHVTIKDNGPGLSKSTNAVPSRSGLGLSNTRERLVQLYGTGERLELIDASEGGLIVKLAIPITASIESVESIASVAEASGYERYRRNGRKEPK